MKVLIIGSEGFIGRTAAEYFKCTLGYDVFGCDILKIRKKNYVFIDAIDKISELFKAKQFHLCINASGSAIVQHSLNNPLKDYQLNAYNVFYILDCIRQYNPTCKFLNLSSAAVYGNPNSNPVLESNPISPISPYGWNKYQSELICKEFFAVYGVGTCSLRIFSVYGIGLKKQLFWDLYEKSSKSNVISIFGTGNESRDFIYISDLLHIMKLVALEGRFIGEALNVANGQEIFIKDAVSVFFSLLKWNGVYQFSGEERKGDPNNWCAEISKIEQLGYKRNVSFEEGLKLYVEWLKN
jgi:UDP-glucose 4-epimerase